MKELFGHDRPLIGVVHLPPLPGAPAYGGDREAVRRRAVEDARSLGIVGAGVQSYTQLEAISEVRDIETVVVSDLREDAVARFVDRFGPTSGRGHG